MVNKTKLMKSETYQLSRYSNYLSVQLIDSSIIMPWSCCAELVKLLICLRPMFCFVILNHCVACKEGNTDSYSTFTWEGYDDLPFPRESASSKGDFSE